MTFSDFWTVYPRHVAKIAARKAYDRACKLVSEEMILEGAKRYANAQNGADQKFTKHPATWLNGGCWEDEPAVSQCTHSVLAAFDRLEQTLTRADDYEASPDDFLGVPPR